MKKTMIFIGILLIALSAITTMTYARSNLNSFGYYPINDSTRPCHSSRRTQTYAWYYMHLSIEDQEVIDILYLDIMSTYDFDGLTAQEKLEIIREVKEQLIQYMIDEAMIPNRWS